MYFSQSLKPNECKVELIENDGTGSVAELISRFASHKVVYNLFQAPLT